MWIDSSQCTKPCSVVISRISSKYKPCVLKQGQETVGESHVPAIKPKKHPRTSFERSLVIQSSATRKERQSSRLNEPESRLRSRQVVKRPSMPAPLDKDYSSSQQLEDRQKTAHSGSAFKASEWQKSTSSNPFKLRLTCLNKEKPVVNKREWALQTNKQNELSKQPKEDSKTLNSELDSMKSTNENENNVEPTLADGSQVTDKSPLSKLVISCKKSHKHQQAALSKELGAKTKEEGNSVKPQKRTSAYTVYTKLNDTNIESINCKRYKKRKEVSKKIERSGTRLRETKASNLWSTLRNFKKDGNIEIAVRDTLDLLVEDVVSAELDDLLNLEAPSEEIRDLMRTFCQQYGYNYDKDFSDLQSSVLSFSVTDSTAYLVEKEAKRNREAIEHEQKSCEEDSSKTSPSQKTSKRKKKRKWQSSDDSDEQECPEMLSAMMRSRSKERRDRLSTQDGRSSSSNAIPAARKRYRRRSSNSRLYITGTDESDDQNLLTNSEIHSNSACLEAATACSDDGEETDCGDNTMKGHIYIPQPSSEDTSDEEMEKETAPNPVCKAEPGNENSRSNSQYKLPPAEQNPEIQSSLVPDPWSCFARNRIATDVVHDLKPDVNMAHLKSFFRTFEDRSSACAKFSNVESMVNSKEHSKDTNLRPESPIKAFTADSPDMDWYSDNLIICLDPQPSEESSGSNAVPAMSDQPSKSSHAPQREISYHTPKLLIDGRVTDFLKPECTSKTSKGTTDIVESKEPPNSCGLEAKTQTTARETQGEEHIPSKLHRTPVQKVLPQVKSASPTRKHHTSSQHHKQQKGLTPIQPKPSKAKHAQDAVSRQNKELSSLANLVKYHQPQSIAAAAHSPLSVTVATPLIVQNSQPACASAPVVTSAAAVPVIPPPPTVLNATPNITITPISVPVNQSLAVQQNPPVTLCSISGAVNSVLMPSSQTNASGNLVTTVSFSDVQSNISTLNNQNLLDISILRSLLLDPPPDGAACTEIHNLILQKAKELDTVEQPVDRDSNLPVITNVVSLNEEVMKKAAETVSNLMNSIPQTSPLPKVPTVPVHEAQRSTDSPVIVEENVKPLTNVAKNPSSDVENMPPDPLNDVLRNLQLEIKNLEKMAEEKKKQYFLIMYVRNFKRETLQRLHNGYRAKACASPNTRKKHQCTESSENNSTYPKETCLVRPMVQSQNIPTTLPSSQAFKTTEPKTASVQEPIKDVAVANLMSDSKNKSFRHSPDVYKPQNITPIHSSLAAIAKIESECRGFRPSFSPSNSMNNSLKETTSVQNCDTNSSTASFANYKPSKHIPKTSPPLPNHHQKTRNSASSPLAPTVIPPRPSSIEPNPNLQSWKGNPSSYYQKSKASSTKQVPTSNPTVSSPYSNSVKNLLKYSTSAPSNSGSCSIPSLVKDACKNSENLNSTRTQTGSAQLLTPAFLDLYPFHAIPPGSNYLQPGPFWSSSMSNNKPNSSVNSQQNTRDMYMNSFPFEAWRAAKSLETESERLGDKAATEKLWNPFSASSHRPYLSSDGPVSGHNLVGHRPFHFGPIQKCVVCKIAEAQFICSGCGKDWYCSVACQRQNWRVHSRSCALPST